VLAVVREGAFEIERDGKPVSGEAEMREALTEHIDGLPEHLSEMKLLRVG
jgi:hypothetical protein